MTDRIYSDPDAHNWRTIAARLAWAQTGEPHTAAEQKALDLYDAAVDAEMEKLRRAGSVNDD